jgi:hypothetical protein
LKMSHSKRDLEKKHAEFAERVAPSEPYWSTYSLVVLGQNYASAIAKALKRDKSLISRQLRVLNELDLIDQYGSGVKQYYQPNWGVMTHYWILSNYDVADVLPSISDVLFEGVPIPNYLGTFYLEPEESRIWRKKKSNEVRALLEPIVPHLSPLVGRIIEQVSDLNDVIDFWDAITEISVAFGVGLPESKYIKLDKVETASDRLLLQTLYNPLIRAWLKIQVQGKLLASNIVRNHVLKIADLLPTKD